MANIPSWVLGLLGGIIALVIIILVIVLVLYFIPSSNNTISSSSQSFSSSSYNSSSNSSSSSSSFIPSPFLPRPSATYAMVTARDESQLLSVAGNTIYYDVYNPNENQFYVFELIGYDPNDPNRGYYNIRNTFYNQQILTASNNILTNAQIVPNSLYQQFEVIWLPDYEQYAINNIGQQQTLSTLYAGSQLVALFEPYDWQNPNKPEQRWLLAQVS